MQLRRKFEIYTILGMLAIALAGTLGEGCRSGGNGDGPPGSGAKGPSVHLYCAAGLKNPVAAAAKTYEQEFGVQVEIQYGGSGTLLSNVQASKMGDLYLAADRSFIDIAREKGLVDEALPLARMKPVIGVKLKNPKNIKSLQDLLREDVKIALANPDAASVGKQTKKLLTEKGLWEPFAAAVKARGVEKPTVNELANDVKLGAVDAAIVWDCTVSQYPELTALPIDGAPEFSTTIAVLKSCKQPTRALHFARYLGAPEKGLKVFEEMGFPPAEGDAWADAPEIAYFSGGVNRVAIQETIANFEQREGVKFLTSYNGCGILVGQMKAGSFCDAYHSCDQSFMKGLENMFEEVTIVSQMDMGIAVAKGNEKNLQTLKDLARPGLKLGVCNEQQSALGKLTADLLRELGLKEDVFKNVVVQQPTADLVVMQLVAGGLDAGIVYEANISQQRNKVDFIRIDHEHARAIQTFAVNRKSTHKLLLQRFFDKLRTAPSKERFEQANFKLMISDS